MPNFRELLAKTKSEIREVNPAEAEGLRDSALFIDVREADENEQGAIPGAIHIPRGFLDVQIEGRVSNKATPIVLYYAGGTRSAFAAKSLGELGYTDVVSMSGGFNQWKDEGREWKAPRTLTSDQRNRYQRHLLLPEISEAGQLKLLDAKVLLLGAGGLGSPSAIYLAAAGVGEIGIVDMDIVDFNLQRQILHNMDRVGMPKVESAKIMLTTMNPDVKINTYDVRLGADNIVDLFSQYDLVVDGTDNFPTRYLVNDASLITNTPVVHGSIFRFEGQVTVFNPHVGPCYRCMFPEPPPPELAPSCAEAGVLGVLCGIIGSLEAVEAVKMLVGIGEPLVGRFLAYDALEEEFRSFKVRRDPNCPACGENAEIVLAEYDQFCMPHVKRSASDESQSPAA